MPKYGSIAIYNIEYRFFYDNNTKHAFDDFIKKLRQYKNLVDSNPDLEFWIWKVEVEQLESCKNGDNPFLAMKEQDVYKFIKSDLEDM